MSSIGAFEAKNTLGGLLDRVENGEEITITRRGKPVARLIPIGRTAKQHSADAFTRIRERRSSLAGTFTWEKLKRDRDEGRR